MKKIVGEKLTRAVNIGAVVDEDERTVEVSLSSEYPVPRWDGDEVLIHENEAIDMSRFPLPLCVAHETYRGVNIGLIENPKIVDKNSGQPCGLVNARKPTTIGPISRMALSGIYQLLPDPSHR